MKEKSFLLILNVCMKYYVRLQEVFIKKNKFNKSVFVSPNNQYGFQR